MRRVLQGLLPASLGRNFRWLWAASTLGNLGDGLLAAAGPLLVASVTLNPLLVSLALVAQQLPWLLFGVLAGAVIDRVDRRHLAMVADLLRAVVLAGLAGMLAAGWVNLPLIYVVFFLLGTCETFADNAGGTLTATIVPPEHLGKANSRIFGSMITANRMAGPPIGGFLFVIAVWIPFGADAVLYAVSVVLISRIVLPRTPGEAETPQASMRQDMAEGLRWLWGYPPIRTLTIMITIFNITFGAGFAVWVLYVTQHLGLPEVGFGWMATATAVGGLAGSMLYGRLERRFRLSTLLRAGLVIETTTHLILALTHWWPATMALMALFGAHAVVWGTTSVTVRQRATPNRLLGRVTSVYLLGSVGGGVIGTALGGGIAQVGGLTAPFWFAFVGSAICTALVWRSLSHVAHAAEVGESAAAGGEATGDPEPA